MDPKRPALAEHPGNKQGSSSRNNAGGEQFTNPGGYHRIASKGLFNLHLFFLNHL
jgi:hypothetical protein